MSEIPVCGEEAVARAIYRAIWEARPTQNPCPYEEQDEPEVTLAMARAAIAAHTAALREAGFKIVGPAPSKEMLIAARDWSLAKNGQGVGNDQATGCWHAMWDAAPPYPPDPEGK